MSHDTTKAGKQHTKACLAHAVISAIENARDNEDFTIEDFERWVYDGEPIRWANEYLDSGTSDCKCYPARGAFSLSSEEYDSMTEQGRVQFYNNLHNETMKMARKGWTQEGARDHLEGMCDMWACGACAINRGER